MVSAPAPPLLRVQLNVEPPPMKVLAVAAVMLIVPVPVPAVVVKLVGFALLNAIVLAAGHTSVPPLKVRFFVPTPVLYVAPLVKVKPLRSRVPLTWATTVEELTVTALKRRKVPPTPLKDTCPKGKVMPFVFIVRGVALVEANVVVRPVVVIVMPADSVKSPKIVRVAADKVPLKPVKFKLRTAPVDRVKV